MRPMWCSTRFRRVSMSAARRTQGRGPQPPCPSFIDTASP